MVKRKFSPKALIGATSGALAVGVVALVVVTKACASAHPAADSPGNAQGANGSAIYWMSSPSLGGQTVMVYGAGLNAVQSVKLDGSGDVPLVAKSATCVQFTLPASLKAGAYHAVLQGPNLPIVVNDPVPYWASAVVDRGEQGSQHLARIFGMCLALAGPPKVTLEGPGGEKALSLQKSQAYEVDAVLPEGLGAGAYKLKMAFPSANGAEITKSVGIDIESPERPGGPVAFSVKSDGMTDVADQLQAALDQAGQNGGTVHIAAGDYMLTKALSIPAGVRLEGDSEGSTYLLFNAPDPMPKNLVTMHKHTSLVNLTLMAKDYENAVVDGRKGDNDHIRLDHVRMRLLRYTGLLKVPDMVKQLERVATYDQGAGDALYLTGDHFEISHCDLYTASRPLFLHGARDGWIHDSIFGAGHLGWYKIEGVKRLIFERNTVEGVDPTAVGGGFGATKGEGLVATEDMVFQGCVFRQFNGGSREAMTTDAPHGCFQGLVTQSSERSVTVNRAEDKDDPKWIGAALYVLAGKGKGQYRQVTAISGGKFEVDRPFEVAPDGTSYISVVPMLRRILILGNSFSDAGPGVQLYGSSEEVTVDSNVAARVVNFTNYGMIYQQGLEPSWYVQWLNNKFVDGANYVWHSPRAYLGNTFLASIAVKTDIVPSPIMIAGTVMRGNDLQDGAFIHLQSRTAPDAESDFDGAIVEQNSIRGAQVGIKITGHPVNVLLGDNKITGCNVPIADGRKRSAN